MKDEEPKEELLSTNKFLSEVKNTCCDIFLRKVIHCNDIVEHNERDTLIVP
jgi:hypothetical protein